VPENCGPATSARSRSSRTRTGDTLGDKAAQVTFPPIGVPEPVMSYAIEPKSRGDEDKISTSLHRLQEEDPTIRYTRDPQTHELLLSGQGQLHIEVTVAKLKRRFGVEVNLKLPRIPYRETITARVEAHGRHKKQTGGHGQFGDCKIRMEPLPRGSDFEFVDDIFGGSIPRQFIPASRRASRTRACAATSPATPWSTSGCRVSTARTTTSTRTSCRSRWRLARVQGRDVAARPTLLEPIMTSRSTRRATTPAT
jgi:elongation factor G